MNPFTHPCLQEAHRVAMASRRQFLDWDAFMAESGRWNRHYLILGNHANAFDKCHRVSIMDHSVAPFPETALVRPYLRAITREQGRPRPRIKNKQLFATEPPLYFAGPLQGDKLTLIDLSAAYWSIYQATSWDLAYDGEHTPRNGRLRFLGADELKQHKLLRNAIIGTARAETRTDLDFGTVRKVAIGDAFQNPDLWAYVQDVLGEIAWEMRLNFGALHILVDGYVIPYPDLAHDAIGHLWDRWGIAATIKAQGPGQVHGLGNWQIGEEIAGVPAFTKHQDDAPLGRVDNMRVGQARPHLWAFHRECQAYQIAA